MITKYQLVLMGERNPFYDIIISTFKKRISDLGLSESSISIIEESTFYTDYQESSPTVSIYFGSDRLLGNMDILNKLVADACYIIPVVSNLEKFPDLVPAVLKSINGFLLQDELHVETLVGRLMECLSLLRVSRRLFISYRRIESRSVAIQLYEFLDQNGFDVFLDTHSISPGDVFQDELWHRLVDTDVVVLLDTPKFLESTWTEQELAKASSMSIGILQIIWPGLDQEPYSKLAFPFYLNKTSFVCRRVKSRSALLRKSILTIIGKEVESIRARSIAARQDNLIQEFTSSCRDLNKKVALQPEKFLILKRPNGDEIAFIPTVGVPHAFTYNQTDESIKARKGKPVTQIYLLYDHRNIREKWLKHLSWLDVHLPIKTMRITEINTELQKF